MTEQQQNSNVSVQPIKLLADGLALVYHEARQVRFLIRSTEKRGHLYCRIATELHESEVPQEPDRWRDVPARTSHEHLLRRPILSPGAAFLARPPRRTAGYACVVLTSEKPRRASVSAASLRHSWLIRAL